MFNLNFQALPLTANYGFSKCRFSKPYMTEYKPILVAHVLYASLKLLDLLDTVCSSLILVVNQFQIFFVLRKKQHQASFLHVHHHVFMVLCTWLMAKFFPVNYSLFCMFLNSFVHSIMYSYYLATTWTKVEISWKKYITLIQIVNANIKFKNFIEMCNFQIQQILVVTQIFLATLWDYCPFISRYVGYVFVINGFIVTRSFIKFYIKNYITNKSQ